MSAEATKESISIFVNGELRKIAPQASVTQLLETLEIHGGRVAIERNRQILPRAEWIETTISDGDQFEIVQFVGGG